MAAEAKLNIFFQSVKRQNILYYRKDLPPILNLCAQGISPLEVADVGLGGN